MRTPNSAFRNRLIAWSICLCALLACSAALSASTATFYLGNANSSNENYLPTGEPTNAVAIAVGPYPGVLSNSTTLNMFFCITGNLGSSWDTDYKGTDYQPNELQTGTGMPTVKQQEEVAFLASLFLSKANNDGITLQTFLASNGRESLNETASSAPGAMTLPYFVNNIQGPIQMAIWDIMGSFPSQYNIRKPDSGSTALAQMTSFEGLALAAWTNFLDPSLHLSPTLATMVSTFNQNALIFSPCTSNQSFVGAYSDQDLINHVPEPGTMVLFGAGALLMGLGCVRRRLAKR